MQPGPIIGIVLALFCIIVGNAMEGGHAGSMVGGPAAIIVLGGTIGAVLVQYPISTCIAGVRAALATFKKPAQDAPALVEEIAEYAQRARRDGILALEKVAETASDPFLRKALTMAVEQALSIGATGADAVRLILLHRQERPVGLFSLDGHPHLKLFAIDPPDLRAYRALTQIGA